MDATTQAAGHPWLRLAVLVACVAHVIFCIARLPTKTYGKRWEQIAQYRELGHVGFQMQYMEPRAAEVVRYLLDHTDEECAVLFRGDWKGAMEYVPALLYPRLLVAAPTVAEAATHAHGHPLAKGSAGDGAAGVLVVVGDGLSLELEVR